MERDTIGRRQAAERPAEFRGSVKSSLKSGESSRRGHAAGRGPRCWRSHVANGVIVSWASQNSVSCLHPAGSDISAISPAVFGMSRGRRPLCRLELLLALHFAAPPFRIETRKDQIEKLGWAIKPRDEKDAARNGDTRIAQPGDVVGRQRGYSVLCAAWRFFIIANHSIDPGCGIGAGSSSRCAFAALIAAACWRYSSKIPSPFIGATRRSVKAHTSASTRSGE